MKMSAKKNSKTIKNKCVRAKIEIEGIQYRCISFFVDNPTKCDEKDWSIFTMKNDKKILIDTHNDLVCDEDRYICSSIAAFARREKDRRARREGRYVRRR